MITIYTALLIVLLPCSNIACFWPFLLLFVSLGRVKSFALHSCPTLYGSICEASTSKILKTFMLPTLPPEEKDKKLMSLKDFRNYSVTRKWHISQETCKTRSSYQSKYRWVILLTFRKIWLSLENFITKYSNLNTNYTNQTNLISNHNTNAILCI